LGADGSVVDASRRLPRWLTGTCSEFVWLEATGTRGHEDETEGRQCRGQVGTASHP